MEKSFLLSKSSKGLKRRERHICGIFNSYIYNHELINLWKKKVLEG